MYKGFHRLFSWLAIISQGPYWAGDVPDIINLHTCPRFRFWLMIESEGTYVDWWCQRRHRHFTGLSDWLSLPIMRKIYRIAYFIGYSAFDIQVRSCIISVASTAEDVGTNVVSCKAEFILTWGCFFIALSHVYFRFGDHQGLSNWSISKRYSTSHLSMSSKKFNINFKSISDSWHRILPVIWKWLRMSVLSLGSGVEPDWKHYSS